MGVFRLSLPGLFGDEVTVTPLHRGLKFGHLTIKFFLIFSLDRVSFVVAQIARSNQLTAEKGERGIMGADLAVGFGKGKGGLVSLIMPVTAITHDIDDDITSKALTEIESKFGDVKHIHGRVAIHMEDGRLDHLRDVGAVDGRAGILRSGREPDLVIYDDVDRAAGAVAEKLGKIECLGDTPLPCKGSVTMNEDGDDGVAIDKGIA